MAFYRNSCGKECFTGFSCNAGSDLSTTVRLDDPAGPLDGPGHQITEMEFSAQMAQYDDTNFGYLRAIEIPGAKFMCCDECIDRFAPKGVHAVDCHNGPFYHQHRYFTAIRAGDSVFVVVEGKIRVNGKKRDVNEGLWMIVMAVVPHSAVLVVAVASTPRYVKIQDDAPNKINSSEVVAMKKGENW